VSFSVLVQASQGVYEPGIAQALTFADIVFNGEVFSGVHDDGALELVELSRRREQFWGDRFGIVTDPYGRAWSIGPHVEDVSADEMQERSKAAMAAMSS
jgi:uncharacterized glyoxalase superfamily protein PhnB